MRSTQSPMMNHKTAFLLIEEVRQLPYSAEIILYVESDTHNRVNAKGLHMPNWP
jgi:hypothetical protein